MGILSKWILRRKNKRESHKCLHKNLNEMFETITQINNTIEDILLINDKKYIRKKKLDDIFGENIKK